MQEVLAVEDPDCLRAGEQFRRSEILVPAEGPAVFPQDRIPIPDQMGASFFAQAYPVVRLLEMTADMMTDAERFLYFEQGFPDKGIDRFADGMPGAFEIPHRIMIATQLEIRVSFVRFPEAHHFLVRMTVVECDQFFHRFQRKVRSGKDVIVPVGAILLCCFQ